MALNNVASGAKAGVAAFGMQPGPGPCDPVLGCPAPTEIVCIDVPKVYDFCFQQHNLGFITTTLPAQCVTGAQVSAACSVTDVSCQEVNRTPVADGFFNVTIMVSVTRNIQVFDAAGNEICCFDTVDNFFKTVTLCAPFGTSVDCFASNTTCNNCVLQLGGTAVSCNVSICLLIETTAVVKLLVPSYGFCVPSECEELAPPPECPPEELFPEQCVPVDTGAAR